MDRLAINKNEADNKGHEIHCHYHPDSDTWIAYGKSAYSLWQMIEDAHIYTIGRYSTELDMASIMVGRSALRKVCSTSDVVVDSDNYIYIATTTPFDNAGYTTWANDIKEASIRKEHRWVCTTVSRYLPKSNYIVDGMNGFARKIKRLLDIIVSGMAMILFAPLFVLTYTMVRCEDGGPAIFKQNSFPTALQCNQTRRIAWAVGSEYPEGTGYIHTEIAEDAL